MALLCTLCLFAWALSYLAPVASAQTAGPDLSFRVRSLGTAIAGVQHTYTLTVKNLGTTPSAPTFFVDALDPGVTFVGATTSAASCTHTNGLILCETAEIPPGGSVRVDVAVVPNVARTIWNAGGVYSGDGVPANNNDAWYAVVTAPASGAGQMTLTSSADATVDSQWPDSNLGSAPSIETDAYPLQSSLLRFDVTGLAGKTITKATLRLFVTDPSPDGGKVYLVSDNTWIETGVAWNSKPAASSTPAASLGAVTTGMWREVDITSLVTGDGPLNLSIATTSTNGADYSSKEGANAPQLVITYE